MKLTEHQAKALLAERGVPTPAGELVTNPAEAGPAATRLGGRVAVKAQVRSGGRGKAGGVVVVDDPTAAAEAAERILAMELAGEPVRELRIEQAADIVTERYLSLTIDPSAGWPMLMRSDRAGSRSSRWPTRSSG